MGIKFSQRSRNAMIGLHPDLVRLLNKAAELATPDEDFMVLEGPRTKEQMAINYGKGRTVAQMLGKGIPGPWAQKYARPAEAKVTWLNNPFTSNHRVHADGFGHAFDAVPYPIDWNDIARFKKMSLLFKRAAKEVGVKVAHGADWSKKDWPHVELA